MNGLRSPPEPNGKERAVLANRRALRLVRWVRDARVSLLASAIVTVIGLVTAMVLGMWTPVGAAALATVATFMAATERLDSGADKAINADRFARGRLWLAVFTIAVVAVEGRDFARGHMELQRQRICGQILVAHVQHHKEPIGGRKRTFTCKSSVRAG